MNEGRCAMRATVCSAASNYGTDSGFYLISEFETSSIEL